MKIKKDLPRKSGKALLSPDLHSEEEEDSSKWPKALKTA